jgi:hypothetical protein
LGEVIFYAIRETIGSKAYTDEVHNGWMKIYSQILNYLVPLVIRCERSEEWSHIAQKRLHQFIDIHNNDMDTLSTESISSSSSSSISGPSVYRFY